MPTMEVVRVDGQKLRKLREQKLWTREELGEMAGVSADQIGRIERGVTTNPQMRTIRGLVKALDVDPTEPLGE
jgi:HTH-type transcriptional regulator, competence development regulator